MKTLDAIKASRQLKRISDSKLDILVYADSIVSIYIQFGEKRWKK